MPAELDAALHRLRLAALRRLAEARGMAVTRDQAAALLRAQPLGAALDMLEAEEARRFRRRRAAEPAAR